MSACLLLSESLRPCSSRCTLFASGCRSCSPPSLNDQDGLLARAWSNVPTSWSCTRGSQGQTCSGNQHTSTPWEPCEPLSVVSDGMKPGKTSSCNTARNVRAAGRFGLRLACRPCLLPGCCCSCACFPLSPNLNLLSQLPAVQALLLPCLVLGVLLLHPWTRGPACRPTLVAKK